MKAILFVDDERSVLDALRTALYRDRARWKLVFVTSGAAALDQLENEPFDVIVSDLKMPTMDGAGLLTRVRSQHPKTVRIVLSGTVEPCADCTLAHEVLHKPCPTASLRTCLERWLAASSR